MVLEKTMLKYSFMKNKAFLGTPKLIVLVGVRYNQFATAVSFEGNTVVLDKTMLGHIQNNSAAYLC